MSLRIPADSSLFLVTDWTAISGRKSQAQFGLSTMLADQGVDKRAPFDRIAGRNLRIVANTEFELDN